MALKQASVQNCSFVATVNPSIVAPGVESLPLNIPLNFSSVANVQVYTGTFTPANDQLTVFTGLLVGAAPNFIIVLCDAQLNLIVENSNAANFINNYPVKRFGFFSSVIDATSFIQQLQLNGLAAGNSPMPQGVPVNYTIITGQAVIV